MPSLIYCQRVGNIMGATAHLALASTIDNGTFDKPKRLGIFHTAQVVALNFTVVLLLLNLRQSKDNLGWINILMTVFSFPYLNTKKPLLSMVS